MGIFYNSVRSDQVCASGLWDNILTHGSSPQKSDLNSMKISRNGLKKSLCCGQTPIISINLDLKKH